MKCIMCILLVFHINDISGQTLILTGDSPYAILGHPFKWWCNGKAYPGAAEGIAFELNGTSIYGPRSTVTINPSKHNIFVKEGSEVKLTCTASCLPVCSFRWLKDGISIANSSKLELKNVQDKDTGSYLCQASNIVNTSSTSIYIQVLDEPLPPRDLKHVFSTSDTICLVWRAGDDGGASQLFHVEIVKKPPDPSTPLNWKPVGDDVDEPLNGGPVTSCLHDLDTSTSYYFRVYASNVHHIGNSSLSLKASTSDPNINGLSFSSGLGLGVVLGLGLVILGLFLGICIIIKHNKQKHRIYDDSDGTPLVKNDHPG
ncbi:hypothetical protein LOTGIDRAFT_169900 [Lottia gigantea]|uniref:Ig-like domain-containing protein n=1 Tax=Lottia gigantea TaxID=225164 RepID=V4B2H5_LOTGI|nr:hypothetical protein LOTGIDRAFT_169900 [Lottia gigantea]ESO82579.1 hypothetical protein LOTGIDRAFT_169900 [Lottia gigantea]